MPESQKDSQSGKTHEVRRRLGAVSTGVQRRAFGRLPPGGEQMLPERWRKARGCFGYAYPQIALSLGICHYLSGDDECSLVARKWDNSAYAVTENIEQFFSPTLG